FSDPVEGNNFLAVEITTISGGTITDNNVAVVAGQFVSAADIAAGQVVFTPNANIAGVNAASFTFQVQDDGGTANGGQDTDQSPNTITVDVAPVNIAPSGTDNTVTTNEDIAYAFKAADFGFSDIDGNALNAVEVTT